jgi:hypothetical protein
MIKVIFFNQLNFIRNQVTLDLDRAPLPFKKEHCGTAVTSPGFESLQMLRAKEDGRYSTGNSRLARLIRSKHQIHTSAKFHGLATEAAKAFQFDTA